LAKIKQTFGKLYEFFCKFHPATRCFTVPMMPSQADFPFHKKWPRWIKGNRSWI